MIVSKLNLGLTVDGFGPAIIAAAVIAIVGGLIYWLLGVLASPSAVRWLGAIINLIIAAVVLLTAGRMLKGLKVNRLCRRHRRRDCHRRRDLGHQLVPRPALAIA